MSTTVGPTAPENDRFLRALARQPVDRPPVWLMRQAGRYLPEYRATRERAGSFLTLCKTPELACEVTLQPIDRFGFDAAILFSDILTIPDAMGLELDFVEGEGPVFGKPVRTPADIDALHVPDPEAELGYVMAAVRVIRRELAGRVPLIGFSGSPWTLACYAVEGGSSKDFTRVKGLMYGDSGAMDRLLDVLARSVAEYLLAQAAAGAQALMIFDTWGGLLPHRWFRRCSLGPMTAVVSRLKNDPRSRELPVILFTKGGGIWLEDLAASGCDALGVDWTQDLGEARRRVGHRVCLQGNLDPQALFAPPEVVRQETRAALESFGRGPGHVFNLGHGIQPTTPIASVEALLDTVRNGTRA